MAAVDAVHLARLDRSLLVKEQPRAICRQRLLVGVALVGSTMLQHAILHVPRLCQRLVRKVALVSRHSDVAFDLEVMHLEHLLRLLLLATRGEEARGQLGLYLLHAH